MSDSGPQISVLQRTLAACSGAVLTSLIVTPFDVVRVRMQQQSAYPLADVALEKTFPVTKIPSGMGVTTCCRDVFWFPSTIDYCVSDVGRSCAVEDVKSAKFRGTWDGMTKIASGEGVAALWRGLSLTLVMSIPSNVVYFTAYEALRDNSGIKSEVLNPLLCGGLARVLSATVVSPIEMIKTRLQSARGPDAVKVVSKGVREMIASQGFTSLWRGLVLTLWRDVPFSSIYWLCVEMIRKRLAQTEYFSKTHPDDTFSQSFLAGCMGGTVAAIFTTPFDVGKTRRQIGHHASTSSKMGILPFMISIVRNEGPSALWVGAMPRILKVAPACAIMISSYEMGKKLFGEQNRREREALEARVVCD